MARSLLSRLLGVHTVTVETFTGTNGRGQATYAAPVQVAGFLDPQSRMVRARDGEEVVSGATFYTTLAQQPAFPLESRVTLPDGSKTAVLKLMPADTGGILARVEHLAVALT